MPQSASARVALYASVGPELTQYDVDVEAPSLVRRSAVTLPANVHYAWPHASGRYLYVASSDSAPGAGAAGDRHHLTAFRIDPSGALTPHGEPVALAVTLRVGVWKASNGEGRPQLDLTASARADAASRAPQAHRDAG